MAAGDFWETRRRVSSMAAPLAATRPVTTEDVIAIFGVWRQKNGLSFEEAIERAESGDAEWLAYLDERVAAGRGMVA